jgi:hypothetical protein
MLMADVLMLLSLAIGTILYFCVHLSPLLNILFNVPILLLWTAGMALLIWNMYGTLGHTCSIANWGNEDGITVCNQYKALFAFVVIGWLCQIALIVLDVRARRNQSALGKYNKMRDSNDLKMDPMHSRDSSVHNLPLGAGMDAASQRLQQQGSQQEQQRPLMQRALTRASSYNSTAPSQAPTYSTQPPTYQSQPQPVQRQNTGGYQQESNPYSTTGYQAYNPNVSNTSNTRFDPGYSTSHSVTMNDFGYGERVQHSTGYNNYYGR